jgi:hypothetical protein
MPRWKPIAAPERRGINVADDTLQGLPRRLQLWQIG